MTGIPFKFHKSFFGDPFFSNCWAPKNKTGGEIGDANQLTSEKPTHFQILLDVQLFKSNEVIVTHAPENKNGIIVEAQHEERTDPCHGYISRQFKRSFNLPSYVLKDQLECHLSSDGVLLLRAPILASPSTTRTVSPDNKTSPSRSPVNTLGQIHQDQGIEKEDDDNDDDGIKNVCELCHNEWSKMKKCDKYFHILPTYELIPFWERRFVGERFRNNLGIHSDHENYKVLLDVSQFLSPGDLEVTCTNHVINIEGKHDMKDDSNGYISRKFTCSYDLPKSVESKDIICSLSPNGILEILAVKMKSRLADSQDDRKIMIEAGAVDD